MATDCRVCNRPKATKFNHFGATSICFSCRAFFMRAAQSDLYKTFYHSFDCKIDAENRKSCKKCRFEKCCTVGMKISYVKTLEEKCQKFIQCQNKTNLVIKRPVNLPEIFVEKTSIEKLHDTLFEAGGAIIFECYYKNPGAFLAHVCQAPFSVVNTDEFESIIDYMDAIIFRKNILTFAKQDEISSDADELLRHNFAKVTTVYRAILFLDGNADEYISYGRKRRGDSYGINECMKMLDHFGRTDIKMNYDMVFASPWAKSTEIEMEHQRIFKVVLVFFKVILELYMYQFLILFRAS